MKLPKIVLPALGVIFLISAATFAFRNSESGEVFHNSESRNIVVSDFSGRVTSRQFQAEGNYQNISVDELHQLILEQFDETENSTWDSAFIEFEEKKEEILELLRACPADVVIALTKKLVGEDGNDWRVVSLLGVRWGEKKITPTIP